MLITYPKISMMMIPVIYDLLSQIKILLCYVF